MTQNTDNTGFNLLLSSNQKNKILQRLEEIETQIQNYNNITNNSIFKEQMILQKINNIDDQYKNTGEQIEKNTNIITENPSLEKELIQMILQENEFLQETMQTLETQFQEALYQDNVSDINGISLEIRGGTGGREAALFAADLLEMYIKFAAKKKWKYQIIDLMKTTEGGVKEVHLSIPVEEAYSLLQFEAGVHRVQRVPLTEALGRVHTSTATVAVLPQLVEIEDIIIDPQELQIDVYRASGAGGQHVNTTESAVRITHLPTGTVVTQQDERSQHRNKEKAMMVLKTRVVQQMKQKQLQAHCEKRLLQIGKGERCEKIRTYNFPQDRVTDHRINFSVFNIQAFMEGDLLENICDQMKKLTATSVLEIYNLS